MLIQGFNYLETKVKFDNLSRDSLCLTYAALVLILTMLILSFVDYLSSIIYLLLSLIFLLYSLRTNQFNRDIEELKIKLEFNKDSVDKTILFSLCPNLKQTRAKTNLNGLVIKNLFFNSVRNTFSIIFVFIILGAPAALAYKVLDTMNVKKEKRYINCINNLDCFDHDKELKELDILFNKIENDN